ncbi:TetR/AcrR family transcriptional regulator [Mycolicibacterium mageritense]|uniref:TetR/AcrR family transcriptional regulator n=1 Tax=Mycolicibacterium mageritense TaxID=53462 RepID=UPI00208B97A7|nr:TetR/AcrR family transcriptional regulator [Mycolicibacterium mageritense]GJJ23101.1 TetR family transcriptional regulator [Mycolicibacterium mageritense]
MPPDRHPRTASRGPRRDALRNDAAVIAAARAVFAEHGPQASMESIAARAGLGVGTIYRRFAGKEELLDAIAQLFVEELDQAAAKALDCPDPGTGLQEFLDFVVDFNAEKYRYAAALADRTTGADVTARTGDKVRELTSKAIDAGVLAPDVTAEDIKALIVALRGVVATRPGAENSAGRRFVRIHLAGLRGNQGRDEILS